MSKRIVPFKIKHIKARYEKTRAEIAEAYKETRSWSGAIRQLIGEPVDEALLKDPEGIIQVTKKKLIKIGFSSEHAAMVVGEDVGYSLFANSIFWEALIDLIEEEKGSRITDAEELQEITGFTEFSLAEIEKWIIIGKESKYESALIEALESRAKFVDLLKIDPKKYGLSEKWKTSLNWWEELDIEHFIAMTIYIHFWRKKGGQTRPSARAVAEHTGTPYPLLSWVANKFEKIGS